METPTVTPLNKYNFGHIVLEHFSQGYNAPIRICSSPFPSTFSLVINIGEGGGARKVFQQMCLKL